MTRGLRPGLIIFDLDGTLIDSSGDIAWAANRALIDMGQEALDPAVIKAAIGWGVKALFERVMPGESAETIGMAREIFLGYYGGRLMEETVIYPGVMDTLAHFHAKGKKLAVVTNKSIGLTERIMDGLGLRRFFAMVLGGDSVANKKPHPEPLLLVMERLGSAPTETVFVGDSAIDCETGHRAGVWTIGAGYGFRGREELINCGCDMVIDRIDELKDVLAG
ncbi:MAG: phosphoglycolate phosphatase [Deltaproteobacteria bacterium]|nr:phosphoglycolate phosphatase [Deltaproteobacteria bacterium]